MNTPINHQFEYVEGQGRPNFPELLAGFQRESDIVASSPGARIDQPYGPHPRQRLDAFPCTGTARGVLLYLHAGYWQSRDKSLFRWLAPAFQRRGLHVVLANYPLCPDVTLPELVQALRPAAAAAHGMAPEWTRLPLVVAGHSAGAHLASEFALGHGQLPKSDPARVDGIWAISGIYDLAPLRDTTLNERLRLDADTARRMSPIHRVGRDGVPAVWLVGGAETPEFLRQNRAMHEAWQAKGHWSACAEAPAKDHFTVLKSWAALEDGLDALFDDWWAAVTARA
ncbi:alpha/beta hydrolase [Variovorax ureilyticus]|uniref:Alpha/beta hydrolase n=1 Tax=Variovorax ureilyticus TaxID=1836198 RepID=A0ABU8VDJ8_9BURK